MNTMTLDELNKLPPLTEAEKQTIRNAKPTPTEDCPAMTVYFKSLAEETGISYQNLINLFLVQCAQEKKRPVFA